MLFEGGKASSLEASNMGGHPAVFKEDLHGLGGEAHLDLLAHELVRHAVAVAVDLDMVVDVHASLCPLGKLVGGCRKRLKGGLIDALEELAPTLSDFLHGTAVELEEFVFDGSIQLSDGEKCVVPQSGQNPPLGHLHAGFHLGFVPGREGAGGDYSDAVMPGHIVVSGVDVGLIEVGFSDA